MVYHKFASTGVSQVCTQVCTRVRIYTQGQNTNTSQVPSLVTTDNSSNHHH